MAFAGVDHRQAGGARDRAEDPVALRKAAEEFKKRYDPKGSNPKMRQIVMIGHSMGCILTNYQIRPGDIFVAVKTEGGDGHDYIADAIQKGARGSTPAIKSNAPPTPIAI